MGAQYEELTIAQGSDVKIELHLEDENGATKNLTNNTPSARMKASYATGDSDSSSFAFVASVKGAATAGIVELAMSNSTTADIPRGRYVYDVKLTFPLDSAGGPTTIERILEGRIEVTPKVT
tara:strand:- start:989 stop:1354 length:366 start_codon:yes stop_codon:yes gene_type:complete